MRRDTASYSIRMMLCLSLSLLVVSLSFRLPIGTSERHSGWGRAGRLVPDFTGLVDVSFRPLNPGIPITDFGEGAPAEDDVGEAEPKVEFVDPVTQPDSAVRQRIDGLTGLPVLEFAEVMPDIAGGIGAYYIRIEYPEEAKQEGIQGRLLLHFVVEPDGSTSEIEVLESLHPLCDSAAVQALRRTSFIPGQQAGRPVRVRMRLPVRFELIDPDSTLSARRFTPGSTAPARRSSAPRASG